MTEINDIKKNVYKKSSKFQKERNEILHQIYNILNVTEKNPIFYLHEIDQKKQEAILGLKENISNYFKTSTWMAFRTDRHTERPYISIIRCVLKDMNIKYKCISQRYRDDESKLISVMKYEITL